MPPGLTTSRLRLDGLRPADAAAVFDACQDPAIQNAIPIPVPYTPADARFYVTAYVRHGEASGDYTVWAVRLRDAPDRGLLGVVELRRDEAAGSGSFGCWFAPASRGRGYAGEAVAAVIDHAFSGRGGDLRVLRWEGLEGNERSRRLALRLGFRLTGATRTVTHRGVRHAAWSATLDRPVGAGGGAAREDGAPGQDARGEDARGEAAQDATG